MQDTAIVCELAPILPLRDMNAAPLCTAVVAHVTNPRALAKMFAILHTKSKHPIILANVEDTDNGDSDGGTTTTTAANEDGGGGGGDELVVKLLEYWGFSVIATGEVSTTFQDIGSGEEWPPLPPLDHLKMVRKNFPAPSSSVSAATEILLGILPQCSRSGDVLGVARRAGLFVCRHLQSVLLVNPAPQPKPSATKQLRETFSVAGSTSQGVAHHPVVGKKTQRAPVNAGELEGVFAGVALTSVPVHSPVRRDNWDRANAVWPLTTPTPRIRHLSITSKKLQVHSTATTTGTELKQKVPQLTADEVFVRNTVDIIRRYKKDFMRLDVSVALVCKVDTGEVIASVKMPREMTDGATNGLMNPYCVDADGDVPHHQKCRLGEQFMNHLPTTSNAAEEAEDGQQHQQDDRSCCDEYSSGLSSSSPFFAHAAFEALRIASVIMYNRYKAKEPSSTLATTTTTSGVEDYLCNGLGLLCNIEPCTMCAMACVHSRLNRLVYLHRNVGGHGGVSGGITTPHEKGDGDGMGGGFRVHCCPSLNHHFTTYEMQFTQEGDSSKNQS